MRHREWRQTDHYTDPNSVPLHAGIEKQSLLLVELSPCAGKENGRHPFSWISPLFSYACASDSLASPRVENQELYDANLTETERKSEGDGANFDANRRKRKRPTAQNPRLIRPIRSIASRLSEHENLDVSRGYTRESHAQMSAALATIPDVISPVMGQAGQGLEPRLGFLAQAGRINWRANRGNRLTEDTAISHLLS